MKIVYSELKKLLPDLHNDYKKLRDDLTLIGHFAAGLEELNNEHIFDLEIRQNRGDCLGYYGVAKELSVFYDISFVIPTIKLSPTTTDYNLPIEIKAKSDVKRILAAKISNLKVKESPDWLKNFLNSHQINSINNIVDVTNYIMFLYGIPCHAFDTTKTTDNLIWEINQGRFQEFTTLDGTALKLDPENLIISNPNQILSLSFIGGQNSGIDLNTKETILEMAVYNRSRVRQDSRSLKTITEASIRLDKELDTELIPQAFSHLTQMVLELGEGELTSNIFKDYSIKPEIPNIEFDSKKPSGYSGVNISPEFSIDILTRLGCNISDNIVTPPSVRKDITLEEDLIEEVIRFYGYNKIPLNEPVSSNILPDITPPILYLIEKLKDELVSFGYDEVRSWPLIQEPIDKKTAIYTQNSINSEYPVLRQSIIQSLENQHDQYQRYKLINQKFFEIGKIYYLENNEYKEKCSLGIYNSNSKELVADLQNLNLNIKINNNFAETILDDLEKYNQYTPSSQHNSAIELTSQIITLDANLTLKEEKNPIELIKEYRQKIGDKYLWQLIITDIYHDPKTNSHRYTFRASYFNTDDKTAKQLHLKTFDLV